MSEFHNRIKIFGAGALVFLGIFVVYPMMTSPPVIPEVVEIPTGTFKMGCHTDSKHYKDRCPKVSQPQHEVTLSRFYMTKYEITNSQWHACYTEKACKYYSRRWDRDGSGNKSRKGGDKGPARYINWHDAMQYAKWLSEKTGQKWRLPSEAEWEYAARAGTKTRYYWGTDDETGCRHGNFMGSMTITSHKGGYPKSAVGKCPLPAGDHPANIGRFSPNDFGLYDMAGNVAEWVLDSYQKINRRDFIPVYYDSSEIDPQPEEKPVFCDGKHCHERCSGRRCRQQYWFSGTRGGDFSSGFREVRTYWRKYERSDSRAQSNGFRLVRVP